MAEAKVNWQPNSSFFVASWQIHLTAALLQTSTLSIFEQNSSTKQHHSAQQAATTNFNKSTITATNLFKNKFKSNHAVKPTTKMASSNAQFENQIAVYRRNRRCLIARNINFRSTRAQFEASVRTRLTKRDSVTFFWPPPTDMRFRHNKKRHEGRVYLGFETRPDARLAEQDLQNYVFNGRAIDVFRAGREAFVSESELAQATAAPAAAASTATIATAAAPAPATTTAAATATTTTTAAAAPAANRNPSESAEEPHTSWW